MTTWCCGVLFGSETAEKALLGLSFVNLFIMILVQKPAKPLPDASLGVIVVEHRDRLARFRYVEQIGSKS